MAFLSNVIWLSFGIFLHDIDWLKQCRLIVYVTSFRPVCKVIHLTSFKGYKVTVEKFSSISFISTANLQLFHQPLLAIDQMIGKIIFWQYLKQYLTNWSQIYIASRYYIFPLCSHNWHPWREWHQRYRAATVAANSQSASHDNWCTRTLLNRIITAQWEGMGM